MPGRGDPTLNPPERRDRPHPWAPLRPHADGAHAGSRASAPRVGEVPAIIAETPPIPAFADAGGMSYLPIPKAPRGHPPGVTAEVRPPRVLLTLVDAPALGAGTEGGASATLLVAATISSEVPRWDGEGRSNRTSLPSIRKDTRTGPSPGTQTTSLALPSNLGSGLPLCATGGPVRSGVPG